MTPMLESLKRAVRRSPLGGPARRLYGAVRRSTLDATARRLVRRIWPPTIQQLDAQYNDETERVMARVLAADSVCLDIGAHRGSVLSSIVRLAPRARHWAFEPLPAFAELLRATFPQVHVCEVALSDRAGAVVFHHAVAAPGWSGLVRRHVEHLFATAWETLTVTAARLDDLVPLETQVAFVKVDVEGGELGVLRGGEQLLRRHRPVIVFEHGLGSADQFGTHPAQVYDFLRGCGFAVTTMARWLWEQPDLTRPEFVRQFETRENFYFMAYPDPRGGWRA